MDVLPPQTLAEQLEILARRRYHQLCARLALGQQRQEAQSLLGGIVKIDGVAARLQRHAAQALAVARIGGHGFYPEW